jgi:hypothetical protein
MGVGHIAVALGASKAAPRLNVGWLVMAALLADFLLGIFAALGLEHATVPDDYASRHYLLFTFPYSHGLLALMAWAAIFGFLVARLYPAEGKRIWIVVAMVVLSHFVLDGLVHVAGLPLAGENSPKLGLGLWNHMPLELMLETLMSLAAIGIYWTLSGSARSAQSRYGIAAFVLLVAALTWTQLAATEAPKPRALTISWIVVPVVFSLIAWALDRKRAHAVRAAESVPNP